MTSRPPFLKKSGTSGGSRAGRRHTSGRTSCELIGSADLEDTEHLLGLAAAVTPFTDAPKEPGPGPAPTVEGRKGEKCESRRLTG